MAHGTTSLDGPRAFDVRLPRRDEPFTDACVRYTLELMLTGSILFWLIIPLPGYVLMRRYWEEELESGLMGTLALSYVLSLALFSPCSILGYVIGMPLWVLSGYVALTIVAAIIIITRRKWWPQIGRMIVAAAGIELLIVAMDMMLGARVGTFMAGDAGVHLARIRYLLDHGLSNADPFVSVYHFFPVYHTNLLHAMYAVTSQLTRCDYLDVWYDSLPWGKLLVTLGAYYMVWTIFRNQWVAWAAAVFTIGVRGPFPYIVYPNQLCPYFLAPMMIGCLVRACRDDSCWADVLRIAAVSLVIGQFHGLYVLFCAMAFGPVLGVVALWRMIKRSPLRWKIAMCCLALVAGFPFILVSKWKTPPANTAPVGENVAISEGGYFVHVGTGMAMRNADKLIDTLGGGVLGTAAWIAGIAIGLIGKQRRSVGVILGGLAGAVAILYIPPLCTFFLKRLGEEWVLQRFDFVIGICHTAIVPGAIASLLVMGQTPRIVLSILSLVALFLGAVSAGHESPDDWETLWNSAKADKGNRQGYLYVLQSLRTLFKTNIPPGETILTDPQNGIGLCALADVRIIASNSASNGVPDLLQRLQDVGTLIDATVPWNIKQPLLKKYGVKYYYPTSPPLEWTYPHLERFFKQGEEKRIIIKFKDE